MAHQTTKVVLKGKLFNTVETRNIFYWGAEASAPLSYSNSVYMTDRVIEIAGYVCAIASKALQFYGVDVYNLVEGDWVALRQLLITQPGLVDGDITSYQTAILATGRTPTKGAIAKKYFPGIAESFTENSNLNWMAMIGFATAVARWIAPINVDGTIWYSGIPSKNSPFTPIHTAIGNSLLSTMRRRKPGYGI